MGIDKIKQKKEKRKKNTEKVYKKCEDGWKKVKKVRKSNTENGTIIKKMKGDKKIYETVNELQKRMNGVKHLSLNWSVEREKMGEW